MRKIPRRLLDSKGGFRSHKIINESGFNWRLVSKSPSPIKTCLEPSDPDPAWTMRFTYSDRLRARPRPKLEPMTPESGWVSNPKIADHVRDVLHQANKGVCYKCFHDPMVAPFLFVMNLARAMFTHHGCNLDTYQSYRFRALTRQRINDLPHVLWSMEYTIGRHLSQSTIKWKYRPWHWYNSWLTQNNLWSMAWRQ